MSISPSPRARIPGNSISSRAVSAKVSSGERVFLRRFEAYLQHHALSPVTIRNYLADLRAFSRWHTTRHARAQTFAPADFRAYREHLCRETQHSPATVNRRLQSLRLFGRFLHETGETAENPTREITLVQNGNGKSPSPRILTSAEAARLLAALRAARPSLAERDAAIVQLMLQAGLRVNEIAALRLGDVTLRGKSARVDVQSKHDAQPRQIPLNAPAVAALRTYLPTRSTIPRVDHLFLSQRGQPISMRSIQRLVDTYARVAELPNVCAQTLRHTCAKRMLNEVQDVELVARWLGQRNAKGLEKYQSSVTHQK